VAASVVAVLAGAQELVFRAMFPLPEVVGFNRILYQKLAGAHPALQETLTRGLVYDRLLVQSAPDGFSETHRLNLYGFRGADFTLAPPADRRRILLIGDSITEGQGAAESGTIDAELRRLAARNRLPWEIVNLGVIGADLPELTALARDAIPLLNPRTVAVILYANDLPAPGYPARLDRPGPPFHRRRAPWWFPRAAELIGRVARGVPIYRRWPHRPVPIFAAVPDPSNPWGAWSAPPPHVDLALYRAMRAATLNPWLEGQSRALPGMLAHDFSTGGSPVRFLARMQAVAAATGARLLVAYVPVAGVVHARYAPALIELGMAPAIAEALHRDPVYRGQNRLLADVCSALGLVFADATDDLVQAEAAGIPQYWPFDIHPRPAGYATIARRILRALQDETR
jgi:lysophospholipase L1-like esterase